MHFSTAQTQNREEAGKKKNKQTQMQFNSILYLNEIYKSVFYMPNITVLGQKTERASSDL